MKLFYAEEYDTIDSHMSDSNIGARKKMNIRNHIFIINSIMNESIRKKSPINLIIADYRQCFDGLWSSEVYNDVFENGLQSRNLSIINEANKNNKISVVTPHGKSKIGLVKNSILQGETFAPLLCSSHVDTVGKECVEEKKYLYMYRNSVGVPPLTMIDDCIGAAKCGIDSIELNEFLNTKTNMKKLQYSETKCFKMHIGPKSEECEQLEINSWKIKNVENLETATYEICDEMGDLVPLKETKSQKYLGDILSSNCQNMENIQKRKKNGYGIIEQIKKILQNVFFGKYFFVAAVLLRESLFINSILLNSEAWFNLTDKEINALTIVDNAL